jgi:Icc-related predicted phosphoesterase
MILIIGDVHGKVSQYRKLLKRYNPEYSFQLGDFGFQKEYDHYMKHCVYTNKIIGGNHDYYPYYEEFKHSFRNWEYYNFDDLKIMTIRGAESVDKHLRTEGIDWFKEEEMSYQEQLRCYDDYCDNKPDIVLSHTAPRSVVKELFDIDTKSTTSQMMEHMLQSHRPLLWVFGHFHKSVQRVIEGTEFICLDELETLELI